MGKSIRKKSTLRRKTMRRKSTLRRKTTGRKKNRRYTKIAGGANPPIHWGERRTEMDKNTRRARVATAAGVGGLVSGGPLGAMVTGASAYAGDKLNRWWNLKREDIILQDLRDKGWLTERAQKAIWPNALPVVNETTVESL